MGPGRPDAVFQRKGGCLPAGGAANQKHPQQTSITALAVSGSSRKRSLLGEKWGVWLLVRKNSVSQLLVLREASL